MLQEILGTEWRSTSRLRSSDNGASAYRSRASEDTNPYSLSANGGLEDVSQARMPVLQDNQLLSTL